MVVGNFSLDSKIAVVTGGGSGICLAFTRLCLNSNCRVLIPDLKLTPEASTLIASSNNRAAYTPCDVSKWSDLTRLPAEVERAFGPGSVADIWVPGAGIFEPKWSSFLYDAEEEFYMQMRVNAEHPIKLTRIAMRSLLGAGKKGVVCLVASGAGITGSYAAALYCATKHAVVGFTKSMAQSDPDENIKIVCICPGMVSTPLWTGAQGDHVRGQYSYTDDVCITADDVAEGMKEMIESEKWKGGSLMEIKKGDLRHELESAQSIVIDADEDSAEMKKFREGLYGPVREVFRRERGVGKTNGAET